jgi:excisionase family DNA binding protein
VSQTTDELRTQEEFDPLAYIEKAFSDGSTPAKATKVDRNSGDSSNGTHNGNGRAVATRTSRKRTLSAPRPRRSKEPVQETKVVTTEVESTWAHLPKIVRFLSSNYDDNVTSNYYRGEFRESREELIQRILDPELSLEEVSRLLGVCPATVRRYTNREWLDHHRTKGGQRRFRLSGVAKFVEEHGRDIEREF